MHRTLLALIAILFVGRTLGAQARWSATLERGFTSYSESAHDTSSPPVRLVPWHPAVYTLRIARDGRRWGLGLSLGYAHGELAGTQGGVVILPGSDYHVFEVAPEIRARIATTSAGATVRVQAGPISDLWFPQGDDVRSTFGGLIGATLSLPLADRWEVAVRTDLAVTTSDRPGRHDAPSPAGIGHHARAVTRPMDERSGEAPDVVVRRGPRLIPSGRARPAGPR
jgi:hypothetical protein